MVGMPTSFELGFCFEGWFGNAAEVVKLLCGGLGGGCEGQGGKGRWCRSWFRRGMFG